MPAVITRYRDRLAEKRYWRILRRGLIKEERERERRVEKVTYRSSVVSCCLRRDKPPLSARMCPGNREREEVGELRSDALILLTNLNCYTPVYILSFLH